MLNISHKHCKQELKFQTYFSECECVHLEKCSHHFGCVKSALALTEGASCHAHCFSSVVALQSSRLKLSSVRYMVHCKVHTSLSAGLAWTCTAIYCTGHWTLDTGHWTLDTVVGCYKGKISSKLNCSLRNTQYSTLD